MTNIILCGGSGTRLWPISRTLMPKQFVKLFDDQSLFQLTVERNAKLCDAQMIVSNQEQFFLAADQLEEMEAKESRYILEPVGRNTAPAIALACMCLPEEEIVLVTPSDHLIKDETAYLKALDEARALAEDDNLVTFGIAPNSPETGFGYIEANDRDVKAFHEKPNEDKAKQYLTAGNYYWNSGMFMFKVGVFLSELQKYAPEIYETSMNALKDIDGTQEIIRIEKEQMRRIPEDSIDYAVMERSERVKVVPANMGWSDLGSFDSLYEELAKDQNGNTRNDDHISINSHNNLVLGNERVIATIDVNDLIVIDTGDALLISQKGSSQKVKEVVVQLKQRGAQLHHIHQTAHRPWGTYTVLEDTQGYKIKRIVVKPGKRLSLQKHFHRSEHWIVVSGSATVTVGDTIKLVRPNESTYIKIGEVHRLSNEGKIPVVLIEVQVGEYTGEDDIVRIEDDYKRIMT